MSDHDSCLSVPGSPAVSFSSLPATTEFSRQGSEVPELLAEDGPSPTPAPTTESGARPLSFPPENSAELATLESQHQRDVNSTSEATCLHSIPHLEPSDVGTRASQTAVEQPFDAAGRSQDVTRTYARRNRILSRGNETATSNFIPVTFSSDGYQGVMYHNEEAIPEPFYFEGNDFLSESCRMVPIHSVLSKVEGTPFKSGAGSSISKCVPDLPSTLQELEGTWVDGQDNFVSDLFQRLSELLPNTKKVYAFLQQDRGYLTDEEKWENVPLNPARENNELYGALVKHINAIMEHFVTDPSRHAANTFNELMPHHSDGDDKNLESKPGIAVLGYGSCLTKEQEILDPSYAQCVAPIEVNIQKSLDITTHRIQLAVYARECFVQQPNRPFIYGLLLTEQTMQLYQFDRGGALYSRAYNIGTEATTFVKIICAISGTDERQVGLDPRIFWNGEKRYFDDLAKGSKRYEILNPNRPCQRLAIRDRGTTAWGIKDNEKEKELLLKFSWKAVGRRTKWTFLDEIRKAGLKHVGSTEQHGELEKLSSLRHGIALRSNHRSKDINAANRQYYWVTQPLYGPPIDEFASVLELFQAFHDAITGSKELTSIGILHHDISPRNILLDRRGLETFGILIDFDMAAKVGREETGVHTDFRMGTRAFQSLKVLSGKSSHEPLDELESCFYSYSWIVFSYVDPQHQKQVLPKFLVEWQSEDLAIAKEAKMLFIGDADVVYLISPGMGSRARLLFTRLQQCFRIVTRKLRRELREGIPRTEEEESLANEHDVVMQDMSQAILSIPQPPINQAEVTEDLTAERLAHYTSVLAMVREAINGEMKVGKKGLPLPVSQNAQTSRAQPVYGHAPQANFLAYSTTSSYSDGNSNKRSPSRNQDDVTDLVPNKRRAKRTKTSHSESRDM
ncbi:hypothetical protein NEOLEDRAFT_1183498 [Neolentinus lepideus HHB14362 ss-1]|uniref:Fungal-type protein kinase domain-containing protein n=1 Tax=Neolentinus lepideus HHB14362 ss-1 TaxID=1314782 RepID=A0A165N962_9AGAM|nr:hypothetical protein NEOLEDRAFT_1183498 [Neolentinus lepideus HHB14362 ss-1]